MRENILKIFGHNVQKFRKAKGWSQEELAEKSSLHRTYIGSIERNERNVSLINIQRIAHALGVRIEDLLKP
jgi:transcriptional regulator with XRE-family HTH domain